MANAAAGSNPLKCIGALDQGTQSTRFILYNLQAQIVASHQQEFGQISRKPGWLEHDPEEVYQTAVTCIDGAIKAAEENLGKIVVTAVGITNQRETTIVWDPKSGRPLYNAIAWPDGRTAAICRRFAKQHGSSDHFRQTTGLPISTYFTAYKFVWLVENVSEVKEAVEQQSCAVGTIDTWLIYKLTGGPDGGKLVTDVTNASRTSLMDLQSQQWHEPTLELFGVPKALLASIHSSAEELGWIKGGPLDGVPITGCLGDQSAALLGQRCREHEIKNTYGTGCFCLLHTGTRCTPSGTGLLTTVARQLGPEAAVEYALEGSIAVAGSGITWLRDKLQLIQSAAESEDVAASVSGTEGVYFVPAFNGLLAPHWRDDARGTIVGMSASTTKAHIVRAMLEAICWQTKEVIDAMKQDLGLDELKLLRADGGASVNSLLMQLQADILQLPVERPAHLETTSLGAAFAAGIGAGVWTEDWVLQQQRCGPERDDHYPWAGGVDQGERFQPQADAADVASRYARWQKAVRRSLDQDDLVDET